MAAILVLVAIGVRETAVARVARAGPRLPPIEAAFFVLFLAEYGLRLAVARFNPRDGSARR